MTLMASGQTDWDRLIRQSETAATQDTQGQPRVVRDLLQVELFSEKLREKVQRADAGSDQVAATRLLAEQGVNGRRVNRSLTTLELKPVYEDLLQADCASTDDYLQSLHQTIITTAIQEAHWDTLAAFDEHVDACVKADWALDKRSLLDSVMPEAYMVDAQTAMMSANPNGNFAGRGAGGAVSSDWQGANLTSRQKSYAEIVKKLNEAQAMQDEYDPVPAFAAEAASQPDGGDRKTTIAMVWDVIRMILAEASGSPASDRTHALLRGARKYLEGGFATQVHNTIRANRSQANLGGTPTNVGQIKAYLRITEKDSSPLDFDSPGGVETTWQRIYLLLRCGYQNDAVEEARHSREAHLAKGSSFIEYLKEWVRLKGILSPDTATTVSHECERLLRATDRAALQKASNRYKLLCYVLLSANRRTADMVLREVQQLFPTIEDFMWFHIALIRPSRQEGSVSSSGAMSEAYTLGDLQSYLVKFPATHYSLQGREPLLFVIVMAFSLQFRAAISFLAKDPTAADFRVDAPHLAIAAFHHNVLDTVGEGRAAALEPGQLVKQYGQQYLGTAPALALEYYMQAAQLLGDALGDVRDVRGKLLRELLTQSNAFGYLLGSGGPNGGGALERFVPDRKERMELVGRVAQECEAAGQLDWAVELLMYANAGRPALRILTQELSDAIGPSLTDNRKADVVKQLIRRGQEAANQLTTSTSEDDGIQLEAFRQLNVIYQLLTASHRGDQARVLELAADIPYIPQEDFLLQRKTEAVSELAQPVAQQLPALLLAMAKALAARGLVARLRTLVAFAGNLPHRISQSIFQELNQMHNSLISVSKS